MRNTRCTHCDEWINLDSTEHMVFIMHDGTESFVHHGHNKHCSHWYLQMNNAKIKCATIHRPDDIPYQHELDLIAQRGID